MNNGARVSVIIATMSRPAELALTVTSAMAGTRAPDEVVVVDASADDRTGLLVTQLAAAFKHVRFVWERTAPSLPRQRNAGLDAATGEFVLFLDDDVTLEPAFLEELLKAFDDATVGGACGVITNQVVPSGYVRFLQRLFRQVRYARRSLLQRSGLPTFLYQPREAAEVKILTGCNMAFRREAVVRFDERINYFDDDDVSLMVARRWRLVQVPAARLEHRVAAGARPAPLDKVRRRVLEQRLLHRRHLTQNFWNVSCYYYSVWGAAAAAALRLKPRLFLGTLLGLWDVHRTRGGLRVDAASEEKLTPKPER
ncbi:MAG: glycosyltransferase [candidate division Zixibacteria bacterium]|nr:glycosyltransferase [candidate division Zixibacteria bacterium]